MMTFCQLEPHHLAAIAVTVEAAKLRNCNYSAANLWSWAPQFDTEVATLEAGFVLRFHFDDGEAYLIVPQAHTMQCYGAIADELLLLGTPIRVLALEDSQALLLAHALGPGSKVTPVRDRQDYIYNRADLEQLHGHHYHDKRNHINKFSQLYPDYQYRPLQPAMFGQCVELSARWRAQQAHPDDPSIEAEAGSMARIFSSWDKLPMQGGAIFVDDRMVAFSYGCEVRSDVIDVCVEKADTAYEGAFSVINHEFVCHLPERFVHVNREEDMGLPGLRKAKLSYNPTLLLSNNTVEQSPMPRIEGVQLRCCTEADAALTHRWMVDEYGFDPAEVRSWLANLSIDWPLSVCATTADGQTAGLLTMSSYRIEQEAETMPREAPDLLARLNSLRYTAVFSFIVARQWRGGGLNYAMLRSLGGALRQYDFVFIPVLRRLKTHTYWQRWGATRFFEDQACIYYLLPLSTEAQNIANQLKTI